jgi:branched-chain amino acid transport system ATP-binding protein
MEALLSVRAVSSGYGDVLALQDISLEIRKGEIVSVVGANGAGKTTLLLTIAGHIKPRGGQVIFDGRDITGEPPHNMAAHGLVMVPEGGRLFPFMTVRENLELGAYHPAARRNLRANLDQVMSLFPILAERQGQLAGRLSGGERQMCAIARAVMSEARLLMLDEPSLGLAPIMVEHVFRLIESLVQSKALTILLVEQNIGEALDMSARGYILERGQIAKTGAGRALLADADVQRAYLGI